MHEKQERDRRRATAPLGMSKANRPSTAGSTSGMPTPMSCNFPRENGVATKQRHCAVQEVRHELSASEDCNLDENQKPAASRRVIAMDPQSLDELDLILG